ncbi:MAG: glycosyltransferase family 2 protein [Acidobacteriota bacterium]
MTILFPVYNDEATVAEVARKSLEILGRFASEWEVIIVDDGSPDRSGEIADGLAERYPEVRVIHHEGNRGYGQAIRTGFASARFEWICFTDGDDEYDVFDLTKLVPHLDSYDLIITFRYIKLYSTFRVFVSWTYNRLVRWLFDTRYRDISTGLRLIRKELASELDLESTSPFIGAEIAIKAMLKGYRVGEVGIQTFPRNFGRGQTTTPANILATILDMFKIRRNIFSSRYELPENRQR